LINCVADSFKFLILEFFLFFSNKIFYFSRNFYKKQNSKPLKESVYKEFGRIRKYSTTINESAASTSTTTRRKS